MTNESIKDLVFRLEPEEVRRVPMYRSKLSSFVRQNIKKTKDCHRTMGLPKEMLTPKPFKKGSRKVVRPDVEKWKPNLPKKGLVPRRSDWSQPLQKDQPNFLLRNVMNVVKMKPPQGPSRAYDKTSKQRFHDCNLLIPPFRLRDGFGTLPEYIKKMKEQLEEKKKKEEEVKAEESNTQNSVPGVKLVAGEEREVLIKGLKDAWAAQTTQYKLLPLVIDSTPMIKKKRLLELSLERIEKNIDLLERNKNIFILGNQIPCIQK